MLISTQIIKLPVFGRISRDLIPSKTTEGFEDGDLERCLFLVGNKQFLTDCTRADFWGRRIIDNRVQNLFPFKDAAL